jgi:hypothetical protein
MLDYTNAQFNRRMLNTPDGKCITCGVPTERDAEPGQYGGGYSSTCLHCLDLFHRGVIIGHTHMFQHPDGYRLASGNENAWPTTVDMRPAIVAGEHVGWFCAGGHGSQPCEWNITTAEAQPQLDAWDARYPRR